MVNYDGTDQYKIKVKKAVYSVVKIHYALHTNLCIAGQNILGILIYSIINKLLLNTFAFSNTAICNDITVTIKTAPESCSSNFHTQKTIKQVNSRMREDFVTSKSRKDMYI